MVFRVSKPCRLIVDKMISDFMILGGSVMGEESEHGI